MSAETWRPIPGWEGGYEVSDLGRIRSTPTRQAGRIRKATVYSNGYGYVSLCHEGRRQRLGAHRAVLMAFVGPCPDGMLACHNNGIKTDNRLENLRWDTPRANYEDAVRHGHYHPTPLRERCKRGHTYTPENTYIQKQGTTLNRQCRACRRFLDARRRAAAVGIAAVSLMGIAPAASATQGHAVCHPKHGGWVVISPDKASSHIDEVTGAPKHEHDGRVDVYAVSVAGVWTCPAIPSPTTPEPSPTSHPTHTETPCPTTSSPSPSSNSSTHTPQPTAPSETATTATSSTSSTTSASKPPTTSDAPTTASRPPSTTTTAYNTGSTPSLPPSAPSSTPASLARTGPVGSAALAGLGLILLLLGAFAYAYAVGSRRGDHK